MPLPAISWLPLIAECYNDFLGARNEWSFPAGQKPEITIARASTNLNHFVYRVTTSDGRFCCKLCLADERQRLHREWSALKTLAQAGVNIAPNPINFDDSYTAVPLPAIVTSWVEGQPISRHRINETTLTALAQTLRRVHEIPLDSVDNFLVGWFQPGDLTEFGASLKKRYASYESWASDTNAPSYRSYAEGLREIKLRRQLDEMAEQASRLLQVIAQEPAPQQLVRTETVLADVLVSAKQEVHLVDWDASGWGDPAYDLASLRWHPQNHELTDHHWEKLRGAYLEGNNDPAFVQRLRVWEALLPYNWCLRSLESLVESMTAETGRRVAGMPESVYRNVRVRFDRYVAAAERALKAAF